MSDPASPLANVGYSGFAASFDDTGLMARLEPQMALARQQLLGVNADGTPKTALSDEDLLAQATAMSAGGGLAPEKLMPLMKAVYSFVMTPDVIAVSVKADPAFTIAEFQSLAAGAAAPTGIDWNSRITLEAHN